MHAEVPWFLVTMAYVALTSLTRCRTAPEPFSTRSWSSRHSLSPRLGSSALSMPARPSWQLQTQRCPSGTRSQRWWRIFNCLTLSCLGMCTWHCNVNTWKGSGGEERRGVEGEGDRQSEGKGGGQYLEGMRDVYTVCRD